MCVVGAITATRATRPSLSIRCATCRPNVVLPAAGVAEARKESPGWARTASTAACCQARRGRVAGHAGRARRRRAAGWVTADDKGRRRVRTGPDGTEVPSLVDHAIDALLRPGLPLGLVGRPGVRDPAVALRRP